MLIPVNRKTVQNIKNPAFTAYAGIYLDIFDDFKNQVEKAGVEMEDAQDPRAQMLTREYLAASGATVRNDGKSIYLNRISPACVACRTGVGTATFFLSLQCSRNCFYCFNPNQEQYDYYTANTRDCIQELDAISERDQRLDCIALTGGEPLLHAEQAIAFFQSARKRFPEAHIRLYTAGDLTNDETLCALRDAGLDEIRYSIRLHERLEDQNHTLHQIAQAMEYIPSVMVEMPVLPGTLERMKEILLELERIGISSINLLEFCFPFNNARTFHEKGYRIKNPPYRVLYNYWYAGGLPIAGSEEECLQLLEFALKQNLTIGIHYCSLENKHTGQVYQQDFHAPTPALAEFSGKDFFFKTVKVFGDDISGVLDRLHDGGVHDHHLDTDLSYLEFHVRDIPLLDGLAVELAICTSVMEPREDGEYLRELRVDLTYPDQFDSEKDL
jgi:pyruvate formate-lyase activating enzyme-like uncharacterized protein